METMRILKMRLPEVEIRIIMVSLKMKMNLCYCLSLRDRLSRVKNKKILKISHRRKKDHKRMKRVKKKRRRWKRKKKGLRFNREALRVDRASRTRAAAELLGEVAATRLALEGHHWDLQVAKRNNCQRSHLLY